MPKAGRSSPSWRSQPFTPDQVDRLVPVLPGRCGNCKTLLRAKDAVGEPIRHQTVDLPPTAAEVTEHLLQQCRCPDCGTVTQPDLPPGVPMGLVGPRLQAMMALLSGRFRNGKTVLVVPFTTNMDRARDPFGVQTS